MPERSSLRHQRYEYHNLWDRLFTVGVAVVMIWGGEAHYDICCDGIEQPKESLIGIRNEC